MRAPGWPEHTTRFACAAAAAVLIAASAALPSQAEGSALTRHCGTVVLTPQSGHGAFDVRATGLTCAQARALLRSSAGLRSWACSKRALQNAVRWTCRSRGRVLAFTLEG